MSNGTKFKVKATSLNLRSKPVVESGTRLAVLPNGHAVTKVGVADDADWWRVSTTLQGSSLEGFVAHRHLVPVAEVDEPSQVGSITAIHLQENKSSSARNQTSGRAFPIGEAGRPKRTGTTSASRSASLLDVVEWLKVDKSARYEPTSSATFCNIYAYDYCYLAGVYLPRVWWTNGAIARLAAGKKVVPRYADTLMELNANALHDWFLEFGLHFGWVREFDLGQLQAAANHGEVAVVCAQRTDRNRSGHITAVVPEKGTRQAARSNGEIVRPLQSQAGRTNFRYGDGSRAWWRGSQFRDFGFWRHP